MTHTALQLVDADYEVGGNCIMEKLYNKMNSVGISSLVMGIVTMVMGIGIGVVMIVNGGRLLSGKKDITF